MDCRLLISELDEPADDRSTVGGPPGVAAGSRGSSWNGSWNMAVDEVLLEGAAARGGATLRFYGWNEPTVSLGYFQQAADRASHPPSRSCRWVRRGTGGGAIVHDRELTYSYTIPASRQVRGAAEELYDAFHEALVEALLDWKVTAYRCGTAKESSSSQWLCFERRAAADLLIGGVKICGSAQRRHDGGILQHGSVLLAASPTAPELPGIAELTGQSMSPRELAAAWLERLSRRMGSRFSREAISDIEIAGASRLQFSQFENSAWNEKR
jgi:lipoate-protein ligase A